jgi:hypothetical protein
LGRSTLILDFRFRLFEPALKLAARSHRKDPHRRLFRHKDALLRILDRPEIPLNTNASENDIRAFVTKRKISGGTVSENGRDARDIMLGLAKTCMKLKLSFYDYLGSRLGLPGTQIPHLAELVRPAPS